MTKEEDLRQQHFNKEEKENSRFGEKG